MENKRMAQEKRDREAAWRNDQESNNQAETTLTNHNEVLNMDGTILRTDNHRWTIWRLLRRKVVELTTRNPQQAFLYPLYYANSSSIVMQANSNKQEC